MTATYCALDTVGFVTEPLVIAERLLADYVGTNFSQSIIFFGRLRSLIYSVKNNTNNMDLAAAAIEKDLTDLYSAYLDSVNVRVTVKPVLNAQGQETSVHEIFMDVNYNSGKGIVNLARTIKTTNEGAIRIISIEAR